jgi:hypothetical protein
MRHSTAALFASSLASCIIWAVLLSLTVSPSNHFCDAFSSSSSSINQNPQAALQSRRLWMSADSRTNNAAAAINVTSTTTTDVVNLTCVTSEQVTLYDGPEWKTLKQCLNIDSNVDFGCLRVLVGTHDNTQVVAVAAALSKSDASVYADSIAPFSDSTSPAIAISTMILALTNVQSCLTTNKALLHSKTPKQASFNWHVVVVGGGDLAIQAAVALKACGVQVTLVTTQSIGTTTAMTGITIIPPAVGEMEIGFCQSIGQFDALLDTIGDESSSASSVARLLSERHGCTVYMSTRSGALSILNQKGIWGIKAANEYVVKQRQMESSPYKIVPPIGFGATVATLLKAGATLTLPIQDKIFLRGYDLQRYWESTTWPRDSAGGANVRYGLPVIDEVDSLDEGQVMIAEPPERMSPKFYGDTDEGEDMEPAPGLSNPFILKIKGVEGLQTEVISKQLDCLLFLSAPFCRTCRYLTPQYQRMARIGTEQSTVIFAKADATGQMGKELGRLLEVVSVPTFFLFRKGKRFGEPLAVTRLPSKKLDAALNLLSTGQDWDEQVIRTAGKISQ